MSDETYQQPYADPEPAATGDGAQEARCTACHSGGLEPGFIEDSGQGSQGYARWIAGALERGLFGGAFKMGKQRWVVEAWRCPACGHLELYARSTT